MSGESPNQSLTICTCTACFGQMEFEAEHAGETITCPHCGKETVLFVTPVQASPPPEPPPPQARPWLAKGWIGLAAVGVVALALLIPLLKSGKLRSPVAADPPTASQNPQPPPGQAPANPTAENRPPTLGELQEQAEKGDAQAESALGMRYYTGDGVETNFFEAAKWFRKAAEQNDAVAQRNLGFCYSEGEGVAKDEVEAVKWFRKAAEQNRAVAQTKLGFCYSRGEGVAKDEVEAVKWFRKAAEQNDALAQTKLGFCYSKGEGVAKDEVAAEKWYRKAAEQGDADAQLVLGFRYERGSGVLVDKAEAYTWYLRAAYQGNTFSQGEIGRLFMEAPNEPENRIDAYMWLSLADSGGDAEATPQKQRVAGKMPGPELAEAKRRVEEFSAEASLAANNLPASGSATGAIRTGSAAWGTNTDSAGYVTNVNLLKPFNVTKTFGRALTNAVLVNLRRGEATYKTPEGATGTLRLDLLPNEVLARLGCSPLTAQAFYLSYLADREEKEERTQQINRQGLEAANAAALRRAALQRAMKTRRALDGRVIQKLDAGLLVSEGGAQDRQIILVKDYSKYHAVAADDRIDFGTGFLVGQYSYTTVQQAKNTIHAYTCSTNAAVEYYLAH